MGKWIGKLLHLLWLGVLIGLVTTLFISAISGRLVTSFFWVMLFAPGIMWLNVVLRAVMPKCFDEVPGPSYQGWKNKVTIIVVYTAIYGFWTYFAIHMLMNS